MYALFFNTYDRYNYSVEHHDLIAVSENKESLKKLIDNDYKLYEGEDHEKADSDEIPHWSIEPVKLV